MWMKQVVCDETELFGGPFYMSKPAGIKRDDELV